MAGRFITFEGGEGAGKTTQLHRLAAHLRNMGRTVVESREPGGTPSAEAIRQLLVRGEPGRWRPESEALLNYAARCEHVNAVIRPALARGEWVLCDRFADSTLAYQGYGRGLGAETVRRLHALVLGDFAPDLTLILDLPVEAGLSRAEARGGRDDRFERMDRDFHGRLRQGYLSIAADEPERCAVIDATADVDTVGDAIWTTVRERLNLPDA